MKTLHCQSLLLILLSSTIHSHAEDITIAPPAGSAFIVKSNNGATDRFKVTESGEVFIPTLPATLAGKPLCWDQGSGLLQTCLDTVGRDFTPPAIDLVSSTVAAAYLTDFPISFSDNIELGWYTTNKDGLVHLFDEGTNAQQRIRHLQIPLGAVYTELVSVVDISGNLTKKSFTITAPATGVTFGYYNLIGTNQFPSDFDCMQAANPTMSSINGATLTQIRLQVGSFVASGIPFGSNGVWNTTDGFRLAVEISYLRQLATPPSTSSIGFQGATLNPLNSTTFTMDTVSGSGGGSSGSYIFGTTGEVRVKPTTPPSVEIDIKTKCNFNNAGWVYGGLATFTASLAP